MGAKILLYDLEVSRSIVEGYGTRWEYKPVKFIRHQLLMSYSYKWLGEKKIHFRHMHGYADQTAFVQSLADIIDQADITIAHNLKRFDDPMGNTLFITNDVSPPSPNHQIDTLQVARRVFKFPSNSLNDLAEYLDLGSKEKITYADIEDEFLRGPSLSIIRKMQKYNDKDVKLLEAIYLKLRPYMKNHPNIAVMGDAEGCPRCGSHDRQYRGYRYTNTMVYRQMHCNNCKAWYRERTADKDIQNRPEFA